MVSKEELYAKYKELKAQGVSISLMELKKQLEAEENSQTSQIGVSSGVSSSSSTVQSEYSNSQSIGVTTPQSDFSQVVGSSNVSENKFNNNGYSNINYATPIEDKSSDVQNSDTSNSNSWTTYTCNQSQSQTQYSGNISSSVQPVNNNYISNFSGNYSFGNDQQITNSGQTQISQQSSQEIQTQKSVYTGNVIQPQTPIEQNQDKKYCLIGYPLGHSLSAYIHEAGFKSINVNTKYEIIETPPDSLVDRIKYLKYNDYAGFNVTIPLKLPITVFLDEIDGSADVVGAVNTVVINQDKTLKGYNTDVSGFRNAIPKDFSLAGKVAGVLGTGGASRAAITALAQSQVKQIKIYTRNIPNSLNLLNFVRKRFPNVEFNAFQIERIRDLSDINILVNTTPIGMLGHSGDMTPVEEKELVTLPAGALVYDVIYNPKKTVLLKLAQKHGYRTINGIDMLIHQAVVAEQIWTGKTPDFKDMKIAALENL